MIKFRFTILQFPSRFIPKNNVNSKRDKHNNKISTYNTEQLEQNVNEINDRNNERLFGNALKSSAVTYNSILPPPNVTGNLHLGHALMTTIQDVICRWKIINGINVNWIPGTDHAGIATQVAVEKKLQWERNLTRFDVGKKQFLEEIVKWKHEKGNSIKDDLMKIGNVFNWEKEYFTLDEHQSYAVTEAFIRLFEMGIIYRKKAMINWCCALGSTISDIEVDRLELDGPKKIIVPGYEHPIRFGEIHEISYKILNEDDEIIVTTTRPETILGDVAVAVNPNDDRYLKFRERSSIQLWHPIRKEPIPLIFDEFADEKFYSGAVKITPAHDKDDLAVAKRHELPIVYVFNEKGIVLNEFEEYAGLKRFIARDKIIEDLSELGLYKRKMSHKMSVPICSRSGDVIEYLLKSHWFLRCDDLQNDAIKAVENKQITIDPPDFEKLWKHWLSKNIDWCLSRQIWWGHQIPAFECNYNGQRDWVAAHSKDEAIEKIKRKWKTASNDEIEIKQDEDVLDTWFSSGLLPFSLNGWPNKQNCSPQNNYPLDILVTGHDILFFWVTRMVILSMKLTSDIPFKRIKLHGIICDENGRKMSKSRGNVITPAQLINGTSSVILQNDLKKLKDDGVLTEKEYSIALKEKKKQFPKGIPGCGVDALRFTLTSYDMRDYYINFNADECYANKKFFNKIWNAVKFLEMNCDKFMISTHIQPKITENILNDFDKWILSRLANTLKFTNDAMEKFNFHLTTKAWKKFFYENLCDVYLESTKLDLWNGSKEDARAHCEVLKLCLSIGLKQLGVFTPFLSNELLKYLPVNVPFENNKWINNKLENDFETILEICSSIRQLKSENKISIKNIPKTHLFMSDDHLIEIMQRNLKIINLITFSTETNIHRMTINEFLGNHQYFYLQSIASKVCTYGIFIDKPPKETKNDVNMVNKKKLKTLEEDLKKRLQSVDRLQKKSRTIPTILSDEIDTIQKKMRTINLLLNSKKC